MVVSIVRVPQKEDTQSPFITKAILKMLNPAI